MSARHKNNTTPEVPLADTTHRCFVCLQPALGRTAQSPGLVIFSCPEHHSICLELLERSLNNREFLVRTILERKAINTQTATP